MSDRALNAVGIAAAVVAISAAAGLALAIFGFAGSASTGPVRTVVVTVSKPGPGPDGPAGTHASSAADLNRGPVPALAERPVRGPAFPIARPRPGTRVALWSAPGRGFVGMLSSRTEFDSAASLSVVREHGRWLGVATPAMPNGQLGWIERNPAKLDVYWTKYSLHVDLSAPALSLRYGNGTVARFLVTIGAPGTETPVGRFGITDAISFDESPAYGCCALALSGRQTRLPSDWTGGDRLAIHGTLGAVGGAESHGCIRATDAEMRMLFRRIPLGTPVFISS